MLSGLKKDAGERLRASAVERIRDRCCQDIDVARRLADAERQERILVQSRIADERSARSARLR
jgi:hypothetical protein